MTAARCVNYDEVVLPLQGAGWVERRDGCNNAERYQWFDLGLLNTDKLRISFMCGLLAALFGWLVPAAVGGCNQKECNIMREIIHGLLLSSPSTALLVACVAGCKTAGSR